MASLSYIESSGLAWTTKKTISLKKNQQSTMKMRRKKKREGWRRERRRRTSGNLGQGSVQEGGHLNPRLTSVREICEQSLCNDS